MCRVTLSQRGRSIRRWLPLNASMLMVNQLLACFCQLCRQRLLVEILSFPALLVLAILTLFHLLYWVEGNGFLIDTDWHCLQDVDNSVSHCLTAPFHLDALEWAPESVANELLSERDAEGGLAAVAAYELVETSGGRRGTLLLLRAQVG